jgi:hypothetical protein
MNIVYICPNFPENLSRFCVQLHRHGVTVLGIGDAEYHDIDPEIRDSLSEYYRVSSLEDDDQVLQAGYYFKGKYGPIDRVESMQEYWIPLEAYLRDQLDVPGFKSDDLRVIHHKSLMKGKFKSAGLRSARGEVLKDEKQAKKFARKIGYPLILKPEYKTERGTTYKIENEEDLNSFLALKEDHPYLMEEFIKGELVTYDGLIDDSGKVVFSTMMKFPRQIIDVVKKDTHLCYFIKREVSADIRKAGEKIIKTFDLSNTFFHFEFFITDRWKKLYALEIHTRPPGLLTTDMWNYAYDIDIYDKWARFVSQGIWEDPGPVKYFVGYVGRKNHIDYHHSHEEVLEYCWPGLVHYEKIPAVFHDLGGDIAYIVRAEELEELLPSIEYIQSC